MSLPLSQPSTRFSDFDRAQMAGRLDCLAEVRSAVVARGRSLLANPRYPDREIIQHIGFLLAGHLRP